MRRFLEFAGDAVLVAHNARFDLGFLDREVERLTGRRLAAPVVDTVWLARRLLEGRTRRVGLASLAYFFGTAASPCHRALARRAGDGRDPRSRLIGLAQERGARDRRRRSSSSRRRGRGALAAKRSLVAGAPTPPGVYLFRDRNDAGALRRPGARPARAAALVLPHASGSGPRSRRRSARSSGSSGACSGRSSRRRSRSCG